MSRLEELRRRWDEDHAKLKALVLMLRQKAAYNDGLASRYQAAQTRLAKFEAAGPPEAVPVEQNVTMRLRGGRTGKRADRLRGAGAHRADEAVRRRGVVRRPGRRARLERLRASRTSCGCWRPAAATRTSSTARSTTPRGRRRSRTPASRGSARGCGRGGSRRPTTTRSWPAGRCSTSCTAAPRTGTAAAARRPAGRSTATSWPAAPSRRSSRSPAASRRGSRSCCWSCPAPRCCCSTSPPTTSTCTPPRRSSTGLAAFEGTVVAVTHDRWFARSFDRFLVFGADGPVYESAEPVWDEARVERAR